MIGAGPFSSASSRPASQPASASSFDTRSVKATASREPYFMRSMVMVEPSPRNPMPWRRLRMISLRCCSSGRPFTSTTLSSMRVKTFTTLRYSSQSKCAFSVNGSRTKLVRFTEPSRQEPYGGSGCSPQGLVARMFSHHQLLFISLTRSMSTKPGSAKS